MIYPDISNDKWIAMTGIDLLKPRFCLKCKGEYRDFKPFAIADYWGFIIKDCGCNNFVYTMTPRTEEMKRFWSDII